jgi:hypothetical protein
MSNREKEIVESVASGNETIPVKNPLRYYQLKRETFRRTLFQRKVIDLRFWVMVMP